MADLREELRRRTVWFYETQLRRLNYNRFRGERWVKPGSAALQLISEPLSTLLIGARPVEFNRVYLDSQQPVWTDDDDARHGKFQYLVGRMGDWLNAVQPVRLAASLGDLKRQYEASEFGSVLNGTLAEFPRTQARRTPDKDCAHQDSLDDGVAQAISRVELAAAKPWLIPELFNGSFADATNPENWVANLEQYVKDFETELSVYAAGFAGSVLTDEPIFNYREGLSLLLKNSSQPGAGKAVNVGLVADEGGKYVYRPSIGTTGLAAQPVSSFGLSQSVKYWAGVIHCSLRECLALKPNSDMGLCQLVRLLYRYGPLPASLQFGDFVPWRDRMPKPATMAAFTRFFAERKKTINDKPNLVARLETAEAKLRIILEESARHPRSPDPNFSVLAGEILKQGLLSYKFWLDEQPRALEYVQLNKLKADFGFGDEQDKEMEFWSENHYIMFASSEYLLGQLWQTDIFQPTRVFGPTSERRGSERRDRGRARVLKWLNNRLMFGWMEFNSSGYYREHLWALLNLVDFALDEEVKTKATMVVDLMLFDVVRYLHHGAMGAAGGRSQFKSKSHGFDNGLTDVVEIILGAKGVFSEGNAEIAASFASSTYVVPEVLLEIGANPPTNPFVDRSRVSVTFDESPKYGITWSQKNNAKDSVMQGYASKRARYSTFLGDVNAEIARTHDGYGSKEDDTVFFWGMSAFFNKQVVANTLQVVHKFGLEKADAFGLPRTVVEYVLPLIRDPGGFAGIHLADLPDAVVSAVTGDEGPDRLDERSADDLSLFLEGSTRTRANVTTYRSPGGMLSSIQNFRTGQLNFQSSVQQATLTGALNVFVNTGYPGTDISNLATGGAGFVVGGFLASTLIGLGAGFIGAAAGAAGAVLANEKLLRGLNIFGKSADADGPSWWTGYWALPRIVQHRSAAIIACDFEDIQEFLTEAGSHAWFPHSGFDQVVERRTSAYDDANFPLLDIGHIGPKGFWVFGKVVHPRKEGTIGPPEEGYIGVFSNKRPDWLTKDNDPYALQLEKAREENEALWTDAPDLFANRDWYVSGKNVWIIQIGSRGEFGSFENFMDRVSSARVHLDDVGTLECTYDIPLPDHEMRNGELVPKSGGADRLRLTYDGEFGLNGGGLATDLFPRFENPFVRRAPGDPVGRVEWGQRRYCLEWNGKSLLHDFGDPKHPVRQENPRVLFNETETIHALVIYLSTGDEDMDEFTVATATVEIGCATATADQVVAAGPVAENTAHDAEWIFFDAPALRSPDMALTLRHPPSADGDAEPSWQATYSLKALMGDCTLRECVISSPQLNFEDEWRSVGPRPFAVRLSKWARWAAVGNDPQATARLLASQRPFSVLLPRQDHHDLFVLDHRQSLWHRRLSCGGTGGEWTTVDTAGAPPPPWTSLPFSWAAVTGPDGRPGLLIISADRLLARTGDADGRWTQPWVPLTPTIPGVPQPVPIVLGFSSAVTLIPSLDPIGASFADVYVTGADGHIYYGHGWHPARDATWGKITVSGFALMPNTPVAVAGRVVFAQATDGSLWRFEPSLFGSGWRKVESPDFLVTAFAVGGDDDRILLAVRTLDGRISVGVQHGDEPFVWSSTTSEDGWTPDARTALSWAAPTDDDKWLFASGTDGTIRFLTNVDGRVDPIWRRVGAGSPAVVAYPSWIETACRTTGQVEVFTASDDDRMIWTWWS